MDVQFTHPEKRGSDEHFGKAGDTEGNNQVQGSPMSGFPCAFDRKESCNCCLSISGKWKPAIRVT